VAAGDAGGRRPFILAECNIVCYDDGPICDGQHITHRRHAPAPAQQTAVTQAESGQPLSREV
jgi:hypothetical protein